MSVIAMNGEVLESPAGTSEPVVILQVEGYLQVTLVVSPPAIDALAWEIRDWEIRDNALVYASAASVPLAELLADVAIIVRRAGSKVLRYPANSKQVSFLAHKIRGDFALVCAVFLARSRGYAIPIRSIPWDDACSALSPKDRNRLVRVFQASLQYARVTAEPRRLGRAPVLSRDGQSYPEVLIQGFDNERVDADSMLTDSQRSDSRELSAQSYWNLRSVADLEQWSPAEVLRLIEEHLSPAEHPLLVHNRGTVSGADWRRLHRWICRSHGSILWPRIVSNQRS